MAKAEIVKCSYCGNEFRDIGLSCPICNRPGPKLREALASKNSRSDSIWWQKVRDGKVEPVE